MTDTTLPVSPPTAAPPRAGGAAPWPKAAVVMPLAEQRGGSETLLYRFLCDNRRGPGVEYAVGFLEDGPMADEVRALGYAVRVFDAGQVRNLPKLARTVADVRDWLRAERVEIAMSWMEKAQLYVGPAASLAGVPSVWWIHGKPSRHWINTWATRLPCRAVFCNAAHAARAQAGMRPLRETRVMGIGVDLSRFDPARLPSPAEARAQLGLPAAGPLVGIVARLQRWKGVHVFVEAAALVAAARPDVNFVVVGGSHFDEPDYPAELERLARERGLGDRIRFAGLQKDVPLWMQAMDVFVHASFDEPAGIVILEALALGKCVIAARTEGPMELANDGEDALFVEPGNPELLAAAVGRVLGDPVLRGRLAAAAPEQARRFGTDALALRVAEGLRELAAKAGK